MNTAHDQMGERQHARMHKTGMVANKKRERKYNTTDDGGDGDGDENNEQ